MNITNNDKSKIENLRLIMLEGYMYLFQRATTILKEKNNDQLDNQFLIDYNLFIQVDIDEYQKKGIKYNIFNAMERAGGEDNLWVKYLLASARNAKKNNELGDNLFLKKITDLISIRQVKN